jgi:hypothetical protein
MLFVPNAVWVIVLAAILVGQPRVFASDPKREVSEGKDLLSQGDAAADKGDTTDAVIRYKRAFEKLLPSMRKLQFKHEVKRDVTAREDMRALLIKEIDEEMTPGEFRAGELGMKALGLLPPETNLKETMVKVYSEEIAAFYDPKTKTMHLIKESPRPRPGSRRRSSSASWGRPGDSTRTTTRPSSRTS